MPWMPIILALISFFTAKKKGNASTATAAGIAAAVGLGSYYVETNTEWGKATLGAIDGSINDALGLGTSPTPTGAIETTVDGQKVVVPVVSNGTKTSTGSWSDGAWKTLQSWGPTGTAAVIGTTAVATGSTSLSKLMPWLLIGGAALLLLR